MNPGHLKAAHDRNEDASFGTIAIDAENVCCVIHHVDGSVRQEVTAPRNQLV